MVERSDYTDAVQTIKTAILQSQYRAARNVNEQQLILYYGIGKYISLNSGNGFWGKGAIDAISKRPGEELPGLRGFSAGSLRDMRIFYEEWAILEKESSDYTVMPGGNLAPVGAKRIKDDVTFWNPPAPGAV